MAAPPLTGTFGNDAGVLPLEPLLAAARSLARSAALTWESSCSVRETVWSIWRFLASRAASCRAWLVGVAGDLEGVHQVAVLPGEQVQHLDAVDGVTGVLGFQQRGEVHAGALDVGGRGTGAEPVLGVLEDLGCLLLIGAQRREHALRALELELGLEVLLDELVSLLVEPFELGLQ